MARAPRQRVRKKKKLGRGKRFATGIDIGTYSVKITTLAGDDSGEIEVRKISVAPLSEPEAAEYPEERYKRQKEALKEALKKHGKLEGRVILGFPRELCTVRYLSLPSGNPDELEEMLFYDVERHVPFSIDSLVLSYQPIERPNEHETYLLMVCAPTKEIEPYVDSCRELGVEIDRIDLDVLGESCAYARSFEPGETVAIVNFGRSTIKLAIVKDGKLLFSRSMPVSERRLLQGFPGAKSWRDLQGRVTAVGALHPKERDHFAHWVDGLSIELLRSVSAFACEPNASKIDRMILTGGAGYFPAGPPRGLSVRVKTKATVETALNGDLPHSEQYHGTEVSTSIGLAIRGLSNEKESLNLLPESFVQERKQLHKSTVRKNITILFFMILMLLGGAGYLKWYEKYLESSAIETFYNERMVESASLERMRKEINTVENYIDGKHSCLNVIQSVLQKLPKQAYISSITFTKRNQLEIVGQMMTDADVQRFLEELNALSPGEGEATYFTNVIPDTRTESLALGTVDMPVQEFRINCYLRWEEEKKNNSGL